MSDNQEQDDAQKTEDPTPKKLEEARKKGQVAVSKEINNCLMLFAGTILVALMAPFAFTNLLEILKAFIERSYAFPSAPGGMGVILGGGLKQVLMALALPLAFLFFVAFLAPFVQVGPLFAPEAIKPEISKISPIKGFKRLFSMRSLMEFAKGLLKLAIIGVVGVIIIYPYFDKFEHFIGLPIPLLMGELKSLVVSLMIGVLIVSIISL